MAESRTGPLHGLRVLDIGMMIAGPMAATLMGDFGAEVIKIEHPVAGDAIRLWPPMKEGHSLWWKVIARNKKLVTLNLGNARGQGILKKLVVDSDVLIENFRPGTLERWGIGPDVLQEINPRLVIARVSGYGQTGPYRHRPGYGTIAEAMTGIPSFTGFPHTPPTLSAFPLADYVAALFAVMGVMFALHWLRADGRGRGQVVDVSLYEPLFRLVESQVVGYDQLRAVKRRNGNRMEEDSPRNAYETIDGEWVVISAGSQRVFERLARAIGQPDLCADERFRDNPSRVEHAEVLDAMIAGWIRERRAGEVLSTFEAHDVVAGPIYDIRRILEDPHYRVRDDIISVADGDFGQIRMQGIVPKLSVTPGAVVHTGFGLGAHNDEVYQQRLGLAENDLRVLKDAGAI